MNEALASRDKVGTLASPGDAGAPAESLQDTLRDFDCEFVGLARVKERIRDIAALVGLAGQRSRLGLSNQRVELHMSFSGPPGSGKSAVARRLAKILHRLGYLRRNDMLTVVRGDLVGRSVSDTATMTRRAIERARGGILYVDQAPCLAALPPGGFGEDAIQILSQAMDAHGDDLVVVWAGYPAELGAFFATRPAIRSRIAHHLPFPAYTVAELLHIADRFLCQNDDCFGKGSRYAFEEYLSLRMQAPGFANARSVQNAIDRARLRRAGRLRSDGSGARTRTALSTIEAVDIRSSSIFLLSQV